MDRRVPLLSLLLLAAPAAQGAFITDKLLVGLYPGLDNLGNPIKVLSSGTTIKVLDRQRGYVKVRLKDGTVGWVELRYVTDNPPAQSRLKELEKRHKKLQKELERGHKALKRVKRATEEAAAARQEVAAAKKALTEAQRRIEDLTARVEHLQEQQRALREERYSDKPAAQLQEKIQELEAKLLQSQVKLARRAKMDEGTAFAENERLRERMRKAAELLALSEEPPTAGETGEEDDGLPAWVPVMFLLSLITGVVAGFALFDVRTRQRQKGPFGQ